MKTYETLLTEDLGGGLLLATINRPHVMNAMGTQVGLDMLDFWDGLQARPNEWRCVILTGAGEKAFSAGGDMKERRGMTDEQWQDQHLIFERSARAMVQCPVPIIGAVNGVAYGGGCEIALLCDFIYASETARFALTEVTLGIMPGSAGTQTMPRAVGERRAMEIILTGTPFSAQQGYEWGLVNKVCAPGKLIEEAVATGRKIADNAPISVRQAKHSIRFGMQMDLQSAMMFEIQAYNRMVPTEDRREGTNAFNEKRKPQYKGR